MPLTKDCSINGVSVKLMHFDRTSSDVMEREMANDKRKRLESAIELELKICKGSIINLTWRLLLPAHELPNHPSSAIGRPRTSD